MAMLLGEWRFGADFFFMSVEPRPKCPICGDTDCVCPPMEGRPYLEEDINVLQTCRQVYGPFPHKALAWAANLHSI